MRDDQADIREHAAIVRAKRLTQLFAFSCLLSQGTDHLYHVEQLYRNETTVDGQRARRMSIRVCGPTTVDLSGIVSVFDTFYLCHHFLTDSSQGYQWTLPEKSERR